MVFSGLVMLWRLAGWPTRTWPSSVKATIDGVVRPPSAFSITLAFSFHHGNAGVGGSEIDANCLRHDQAPCSKDACKRFRRFRLCSINMRDAPGASGGKTASASRGRLGDSSGGLILLLGFFLNLDFLRLGFSRL